MNNWKNIWEKRTFDSNVLDSKDKYKVFAELKRANGYDIVEGGITLDAFKKQYKEFKACFADNFPDKSFSHIKSIYEVGCGSGANLFMFEQEGLTVGGLDFSEKLISIAKKVLKSNDIKCSEAVDIPTDKKYDFVFSDGVFHYFSDIQYASNVMQKMYEITNYGIGFIGIHDVDKKESFIKFRKQLVENYEEKYKNLDKLFYDKEFFKDFASKRNMKVVFEDSCLEGYWNNNFIFNCFMYK